MTDVTKLSKRVKSIVTQNRYIIDKIDVSQKLYHGQSSYIFCHQDNDQIVIRVSNHDTSQHYDYKIFLTSDIEFQLASLKQSLKFRSELRRKNGLHS